MNEWVIIIACNKQAIITSYLDFHNSLSNLPAILFLSNLSFSLAQ